jgi:hypothetical protein
MADRLQTILRLLDAGLVLYRRNFVAFLLIAAGSIVPVAIVTGLLVAAADRLDELQVVLLFFGSAAALLPLLLYLVGALSRAAGMAADGPVELRAALAIPPGRIASMGCFAVVYSIVMQVVSSALSMLCICPLWIFGVAAVGVLGAAGEESALGAAVLVLIGVLFGGVYLFVLLVGGASYSSLVYALQPWAQEGLPFGQAIERSVTMIGYRFWRNAAAWGLSAVLLAAGGMTVSLAVGLIGPLPAVLALGAESRVAQAVSASAWLLGLILVLPPLPIWMALLYRENAEARSGGDLEAKVRAWLGDSSG